MPDWCPCQSKSDFNAAKDKGFVKTEQVDELMAEALAQISGQKLADEGALTGNDAACQKVIADLKKTKS